jgi:hypothetical protein
MHWIKITEKELPPNNSKLVMWFFEDKRRLYGSGQNFAIVSTGLEAHKLGKYFSHYAVYDCELVIEEPKD